jgi:3alpha(or 20beta)-hydroxysteroid dehydrogenase
MTSPSGQLAGKVALITGAARGMGAAEAELFAARGAAVILADVRDELGAETARRIGDRAVFEHLDVARESDWQRVVRAGTERFGAITVLVNNAGIAGPRRPLDQISLDEFLHVVSVNQVGVFLGMRTVYPGMVAAGGGSIINVSSTAGAIAFESLGPYVTTKFAIRGLSRAAAADWASQGIRVNTIMPGTIDTPIREKGSAVDDTSPLGRIGQADEAARLACFLASEESSYCTGADFVIDGGLLARYPSPRI